MKRLYLLFFIITISLQARNLGETEITTEEGIEVFQKEKHYILKKNVEIQSDNFNLKADNVKAYFDKDLYDITVMYSKGNVIIKSSQGLKVLGNEVDYNVKEEDIYVKGKKSFLQNAEITMLSDESIRVKNLTGEFHLIGENSQLITTNIKITGDDIQGIYGNIDGENKVDKLTVEDNNEVYIKTKSLEMYALKATYNNKINIIELFDRVKIIRNEEIITGDYAKINTSDESYKIKSKESKKVKALLKNTNETN